MSTALDQMGTHLSPSNHLPHMATALPLLSFHSNPARWGLLSEPLWTSSKVLIVQLRVYPNDGYYLWSPGLLYGVAKHAVHWSYFATFVTLRVVNEGSCNHALQESKHVCLAVNHCIMEYITLHMTAVHQEHTRDILGLLFQQTCTCMAILPTLILRMLWVATHDQSSLR